MTVPSTPPPSLLAKKLWVRRLYVGLGFLFLVVGILGIFLPILPTTPFLLISASCFARGSERFYLWLMNHPHIGPPLREWREHHDLPLQVKAVAISSLWIGLGTSIYFFVSSNPARWILAGIGLAGTIYILRIPTRQPRL